ncbi:MAG: AbrB/MazE/SpoVT family DNA-binding domain-containing protein [Planctomycetota bacterium]
MYRKVFRQSSSYHVIIPPSYLKALDLEAGSRVEMLLDEDNRRIVILPAPPVPTEIDRAFAGQVDRCLERYSRVLRRLSSRSLRPESLGEKALGEKGEDAGVRAGE